MPCHFERFRMLNGSGHPVRQTTYAGDDTAPPKGGMRMPTQTPVDPANPLPPGGFRDDVPLDGPHDPYRDLCSIVIESIQMEGGGAGLSNWPLYFAQGVNVRSVELEVLEVAPGGPFQAQARLTYEDYSGSEFVSPEFA
jgi:hypothetical protein